MQERPIQSPFEPLPRPPMWITRQLARIGGVDPARLASCDGDERRDAVIAGLATAGGFAFLTLTIASALDQAFAGPDQTWLAWLPAAALAAGLVSLIDQSILSAIIWRRGYDEALRAGYEPIRTRGGERVARAALLATRVALAVSLAATLSLFVDLWLYRGDIEERVETSRRAANAASVERARAIVEAERTSLAAAAQTARERATALAREAQAASQRREEAARARQAQTQSLDAALAEQRRRATAAEDDMRAEQGGARSTPRHSGVPGKGYRYQAAQDAAGRADARAQADAQALERRRAAEAQAQIDDRRESEARNRELDAALARVRDAEDALAQAASGAGARVAALAEADPAFVRGRIGLVTRIETLAELAARPLTVAAMAGVAALIMMLEMAGFLVRLGANRPSLCATGAALGFETQAARMAASAQETLGAAEARREAALSARDGRDAARETLRRDAETRRWAREAVSRELKGAAPEKDAAGSR